MGLGRPDPLDGAAAVWAFIFFDLVFDDPVAEPLDDDLLTVRAGCILPSCARYIAFIDIFEP